MPASQANSAAVLPPRAGSAAVQPSRAGSVAVQPSRAGSAAVRSASALAREGPNPPDVVGFGAPIFYLDEAEGQIVVDIMRVGDLAGECGVSWHTEDGSAVAGEKYNAGDGSVDFADGEWLKQITITTNQDDFWAPTLEFKVILSDDHGCVISDLLRFCRVKICDDDPFPSGKYRDDLLDGKNGLKQIPGVGLFWEYFKLNLTSRGMYWRVVVVVIFDQLQNFYLAFTIFVSMYLVDILFKQHDQETQHELFAPTRQKTATLLGIVYILPRLLLHVWGVVRVHLDLSGRARRFLQEGLFRKYMNYSEASRNEVKESDMLVSVTEDASELAEAFVGVLDLFCLGGKLLVLSFFVLRENPETLWACVVMPAMMLIFACTRFNVLIKTAAAEGDTQVAMVALADETCDKFRLIAAYGQKPDVCDMFQDKVRAVTKKHVVSNCVDCNNSQVPAWVGATFVGGYIAMNAHEVLEQTEKLGVFLATVAILDQIASDFAGFYSIVMALAKSLEPLKGLTHLFNLPMDLAVLKRTAEQCGDKTNEKLTAVLAGSTEGAKGTREEFLVFAADKLDIELVDVSFAYHLAHHEDKAIINHVSLAVSQATIVAITGEHGAGRSSFLSLMGGLHHPESGFIFVPQHLRTLHVSQAPIILSLSLLENLTFGGIPSNVPGRIQTILKRLKMPHMVAVLNEELAVDGEKQRRARRKAAREVHKKAAEVGSGARQVHAAKKRKISGQAIKDAPEDEEFSDSEDEDEDEEDPGGDGENVAAWHETATYSDRCKIHLARALIVNPEVMVLQRPLYHYDKKESMEVLAILKSYVEHRGYCMPRGQPELDRRPRTAFFVPEDLDHASQADVVWHLDGKSHHVRELKGHQVRACLNEEFEFRRPGEVW